MDQPQSAAPKPASPRPIVVIGAGGIVRNAQGYRSRLCTGTVKSAPPGLVHPSIWPDCEECSSSITQLNDSKPIHSCKPLLFASRSTKVSREWNRSTL